MIENGGNIKDTLTRWRFPTSCQRHSYKTSPSAVPFKRSLRLDSKRLLADHLGCELWLLVGLKDLSYSKISVTYIKNIIHPAAFHHHHGSGGGNAQKLHGSGGLFLPL